MEKRFEIDDVIVDNIDYIVSTICEDEVETLSERQLSAILSPIKQNKCLEIETRGDMNMGVSMIAVLPIIITALQLICQYFDLHYPYSNKKNADIDFVAALAENSNDFLLDEASMNLITERKDQINEVLRKLFEYKNK